ncbi:MAG: AAA family ATPase, partial [Bacillota bacterium]|nr:AAA family ATPase [Bacillota bacterium]
MRLLKLTLTNFKGIKDFTLNAGGQSQSVFGANGTGKTTLFDAFTWLLFDKDSQGKKDFDIKTIDASGKVIHGLNHEVEAVFYLDARTLTLKKVYAEKWTKKRGSATAEFTGHTTDHFIDGVPVSKSEYTAKIAEIVDESIFKLLTSPSYFNEQLHWQERRRILLEVCGDLTDEEVIASDKKLIKLPDILQGRKLEDHRKVIASRRAEINKELEKIPVRIDETSRGLLDITNLVPEALESDIAKLQVLIKDKQQEISRIENGGEVAEKRKILAEIDGELLKIKTNHRSQFDGLIIEKQKSLNDIKGRVFDITREIEDCQSAIAQNNCTVENLEAKLIQLRSRWSEVDSRQLDYQQDDNCPTCGQSLPEEKLAEAREKALARFNHTKAEELQRISIEGKQGKAEVDRLKTENAELQRKIDVAQKTLAATEETIQLIQSEITDLLEQADNYTQNSSYIEKLKEKDKLNNQIQELQTGTQDAISRLLGEIVEIEASIGTLRQAQTKVEQRKHGEMRIEELKAQEKQLAAEFEKLEGELYLTEEFIRSKVKLLEERINSKFKYARFKLFDIQVNGGVSECCETLYQGVPYSSGLNNAARINVGIDIINTLA